MSKSGQDSANSLGYGKRESDSLVVSGVVRGYRDDAMHPTRLSEGEHRAGAIDAQASSTEAVCEMLRDAAVTHDIPLPPLSERGTRLRGSLVPPVDVPAIVTLIVFAWHNANPGPLHWSFANVEEAARAAHVLRNAVGWAVVRGDESDVNRARLVGGVLLEQDVGQGQ